MWAPETAEKKTTSVIDCIAVTVVICRLQPSQPPASHLQPKKSREKTLLLFDVRNDRETVKLGENHKKLHQNDRKANDICSLTFSNKYVDYIYRLKKKNGLKLNGSLRAIVSIVEGHACIINWNVMHEAKRKPDWKKATLF